MTNAPIPVETTDDIQAAHRDVSGRDAETVAQLLNDDADAVVWLPTWLTEEKALEYAHGDAQVAAGQIEAETDKAWCWSQANAPGETDGVWLPKSQVVVFQTADGANEVGSSQKRLGDV